MLIVDMETQWRPNINTAFDDHNSSRQGRFGAAHPSGTDLEGVWGTAKQSGRCGRMIFHY